LGLTADSTPTLNALSDELDRTYRAVAARLPDNPAVRFETVGDKSELILSPFDKLDEPTSLVELRQKVASMLPRVDLPELILEIAARTGFTDAFTHISERTARATDLHISVCAVLMAEACNTGIEPLIRGDVPALQRVQGRRGWVRLHEKGGKEHEMPTHHNLDNYLEAYIAAAKISKDRKGPLFRTTRGRSGELTGNALLQSDVWRMIRRRALAAGIKTEIGCHTFRATGITAYLKNGGKLEIAQQMAAHESARTTGLYDRRGDEVSLDEVERIGI
jgi:integrase